jgi:hypothetical protein
VLELAGAALVAHLGVGRTLGDGRSEPTGFRDTHRCRIDQGLPGARQLDVGSNGTCRPECRRKEDKDQDYRDRDEDDATQRLRRDLPEFRSPVPESPPPQGSTQTRSDRLVGHRPIGGAAPTVTARASRTPRIPRRRPSASRSPCRRACCSTMVPVLAARCLPVSMASVAVMMSSSRKAPLKLAAHDRGRWIVRPMRRRVTRDAFRQRAATTRLRHDSPSCGPLAPAVRRKATAGASRTKGVGSVRSPG